MALSFMGSGVAIDDLLDYLIARALIPNATVAGR
jgi:hypothetical protein